jgi:hypothetical protein
MSKTNMGLEEPEKCVCEILIYNIKVGMSSISNSTVVIVINLEF